MGGSPPQKLDHAQPRIEQADEQVGGKQEAGNHPRGLLVLLLACVNFLGDALDDALNPRAAA